MLVLLLGVFFQTSGGYPIRIFSQNIFLSFRVGMEDPHIFCTYVIRKLVLQGIYYGVQLVVVPNRLLLEFETWLCSTRLWYTSGSIRN
jgi:hypothetical protein